MRDAEHALQDGYWIAGALSYELGAQSAGIDGAFEAPLLVLGAFKPPRLRYWYGRAARFDLTAPLPRLSFDRYAPAIERIRERIADGEVYQVNYTVPFDLRFAGDPLALYRFLARRAKAKYAAFVQHGDVSLVSLSPELFLSFEGERVRTKPMKGTANLRDSVELRNEKNQAEHVMIVDLLRNDLQRFCADVTVERLCETERYPTFLTMTSTIAGRMLSPSPFSTALGAAFPCGSVTGAPKRAAMQHIAQLEESPRGFYTGSIGYLSPRRRGWWNVAIRTLQIHGTQARFDAGGGIVTDSRASGEWNEIALKGAFLRPAYRDFALIETFRAGPQASDVEAHHKRLLRSARTFGFDVRRADLERAVARFLDSPAPLLVRLIVTPRRIRVHAEPLRPMDQPVRLCLSAQRVDSNDPFLRHKTSWRPAHEAATREARDRGCFDALLLNERGKITEGSRTNIFVQMGEMLYTPPLRCGPLPGILRAQLLERKAVEERELMVEDLETADAIFAGNSARGMLRAQLVI